MSNVSDTGRLCHILDEEKKTTQINRFIGNADNFHIAHTKLLCSNSEYISLCNTYIHSSDDMENVVRSKQILFIVIHGIFLKKNRRDNERKEKAVDKKIQSILVSNTSQDTRSLEVYPEP